MRHYLGAGLLGLLFIAIGVIPRLASALPRLSTPEWQVLFLIWVASTLILGSVNALVDKHTKTPELSARLASAHSLSFLRGAILGTIFVFYLFLQDLINHRPANAWAVGITFSIVIFSALGCWFTEFSSAGKNPQQPKRGLFEWLKRD